MMSNPWRCICGYLVLWKMQKVGCWQGGLPLSYHNDNVFMLTVTAICHIERPSFLSLSCLLHRGWLPFLTLFTSIWQVALLQHKYCHLTVVEDTKRVDSRSSNFWGPTLEGDEKDSEKVGCCWEGPISVLCQYDDIFMLTMSVIYYHWESSFQPQLLAI